jgi:hypothetical protein
MQPRLVALSVILLTLMCGTAALVAQVPKQKPGLEPAPVQASDLIVTLAPVGSIPVHTNPTSPIVAGSALLLIDQSGYLYRWDGTRAVELLSPGTVPNGIRLVGNEHILNAAANADGSILYVMFMSASAPNGVPRRTSPREPDAWLVLYAYEFDGTRLGAAKAVTALQVRTDGHVGGGLTVLPDGSLLFATGDNGDSYEDGRDYSQNAGVPLAKIVRIDPADGSIRILALGVRCAQRLALTTFDGERWLAFADPGGWIAEEINAVRLSDLLGAAAPLNFGWGRSAADRKAREGTFYIDAVGNSEATIGAAEPGFVDPVAQFGREREAAVAVSGPVASASSFKRIALLFGDLVSGAVYAVTSSPATTRQATVRVNLVDEMARPITLKAIVQDGRPDPRFFNFPDGSAGVLLEKNGMFYRLSEMK